MRKLVHPFLLTIIISWVFFSGCSPKWEIKNPYDNVDWENHLQYKANLHTHTTRSDGRLSPQNVVDNYHGLGYKILAVTDHNEVTFPWTSFSTMSSSAKSKERIEEGEISADEIVFENRNPAEMGMLAIQGNEVSSPHHIGSYFSDYQQRTEEEQIAIKGIIEKNGLMLFNHPGRYTKGNPDKYNVDWYVDHFSRYNHLTGMEVYNQGDRYPTDRVLWDSILCRTMPDRPVWGYSNDDFHNGEKKLGRNWNVFVLPELNEEWLRKGMLEGRFFYVYASEGHFGPQPPQIKSVNVNNKKGTIEIQVSGQDSIRWISGGKVVTRGHLVHLSEIPDLNTYVRAEIFGPGTITGTQPFGLEKQE